jgi:hypothetical protein
MCIQNPEHPDDNLNISEKSGHRQPGIEGELADPERVWLSSILGEECSFSANGIDSIVFALVDGLLTLAIVGQYRNGTAHKRFGLLPNT